MEYSRAEAKERAFAKWIGVCNVILPSFTADLKGLNEKAIRHDVRRNIEHGFWGTLLVSECGTTAAEYRQFMEIAVDEAKGRHFFLMHGTFDTPDEIVVQIEAPDREVEQRSHLVRLDEWREHARRCLRRAHADRSVVDDVDRRATPSQLMRDSAANNAGADDDDVRGTRHESFILQRSQGGISP